MKFTPEKEAEYLLTQNKLIFQNMQLTRMIWALVKMAGGEVKVDPGQIAALWNLKKAHEGDLVVLTADVLPDLPEESIKKAAEVILKKQDLGETMKEFEFHYYPLPYVHLRLAPYARYDKVSDKWIRVGPSTDGSN